jgi:prevent-host-death family protein
MGIRQLRANLSAALDRVQTGEVIEVTEHDRPVARIVPIAYRSRVD